MATTTKPRTKLSISLPAAMVEQVERTRQIEHRTRSELVREALRTYFAMSRLPEEEPTPEEIRALRRGRAAVARGDFVTLDKLRARYQLDHPRRRASRKVSR
jgi:Arc/MetJ-type ribon-helix-helix transcriptional regulator